MMATATPTAAKANAQAIANLVELGDVARALIEPEQSAAAYFNALVKKELYKDAVSFLAHWLTPREAVWWNCECVWHTCRPEPLAVVDAALGAAVAWVLEPTEEHRLAAEQAGQRATIRTSAGCAALAAGWTGGNMSPYAKSPVAPPRYLWAKTVASAANLIAAQGPPAKMAQRYLQLLRIGTEVAQGSNRWIVAEASA